MNFQALFSFLTIVAFGAIVTTQDGDTISVVIETNDDTETVTVRQCPADYNPCVNTTAGLFEDCDEIVADIIRRDSFCGREWDGFCVVAYNDCYNTNCNQELVDIIAANTGQSGINRTQIECPPTAEPTPRPTPFPVATGAPRTPAPTRDPTPRPTPLPVATGAPRSPEPTVLGKGKGGKGSKGSKGSKSKGTKSKGKGGAFGKGKGKDGSKDGSKGGSKDGSKSGSKGAVPGAGKGGGKGSGKDGSKAGSKGGKGYYGSKGGKGYYGSKGGKGYYGSKGGKGYYGSKGGKGYYGSKGGKGYYGSKGGKGYYGSKGGYYGSKGGKGYYGAKGSKGYYSDGARFYQASLTSGGNSEGVVSASLTDSSLLGINAVSSATSIGSILSLVAAVGVTIASLF